MRDGRRSRKLEYVNELMAEIAGEKPLVTRRLKVEPLSHLTQTLAEHYEKKRAYHSIEYPKVYDRDLRRIFSRRSEASPLADGCRIFAAQPRQDQANRFEMDRRVSADARFRFR